MERVVLLSITMFTCTSCFVNADTFGTGANQFDIEFVLISGDASTVNGTSIGSRTYFSDPADFRMGRFEVTNEQWNKFTANNGLVTGNPPHAYDKTPGFTGANVPTNCVSWYEAAQFVNWLNTSTGHQAAYHFTGTQGNSDYTFAPWNIGDTGYNPNNPFRNSNAYYFLPTDSEWVKAAYWNGVNLQTYATKPGESAYQGDKSNGGWNYHQYANPDGLWNVGTGSEELNGTYDMMGNVAEWMENRYFADGVYPTDQGRGLRGGSISTWGDLGLSINVRSCYYPWDDDSSITGFRVASVPEPVTAVLLGMGVMALRRRKRA